MKRILLKPEMKLGAEPKKVALLAGLAVVGVIVYFINSSDSPAPSPSAPAARPPASVVVPSPQVRVPGAAKAPSRNIFSRGSAKGGGQTQEFRPTLKPKDPIDPSKIDPTLRMPLLAKLKSVNIEGGGRSLFDFSAAPVAAPKVELAKVKPIIPGAPQVRPFIGPVLPKPAVAAAAPPPPPPPPIPLKFYGFANAGKSVSTHKRAFFLEGEDIFVAGEGELIKNRYKVVRIGVNSAVVEDTSNKNQQTLPLEAEMVVAS